MSAAPDATGIAQPDSFAFTPESLAKAKAEIAKYPPGRQASAVLALLDLAQRQHDNWLPRAAMDTVADILEMSRIEAVVPVGSAAMNRAMSSELAPSSSKKSTC